MTLPILVDPALLGTAAATESAGAASIAGASAAAAPTITAVLPPGIDEVSVGAAAALNARGAATTGVLAEFTAMRGMFADNVGVSGASYAGVEIANATDAFI